MTQAEINEGKILVVEDEAVPRRLLVLLMATQVGGDVWLNERESANATGIDPQAG